MPVVIEELDVEVEASPPAAGSAARHPAGTAELTAADLDEVARQLAARRDRVRAD